METGEIQAEVQRILKDSKNEKEIIENIAIMRVFTHLLQYGSHYGIEEGLVFDPSEKPDVKQSYPFLKEKIFNKAFEREKEIKKDLKEKYEEKYGKMETEKTDT